LVGYVEKGLGFDMYTPPPLVIFMYCFVFICRGISFFIVQRTKLWIVVT